MIEAIVFDVDGTLWDSSETVTKAWNLVFARRNLPPCEIGQIRDCMGLTLDEIGARFFPDLSSGARSEILAECMECQRGILKEEGGRLYPGVKEMLPALCLKYALYIVSNCECGYIENLLSFCGLEPYFRGFLCAGMTGKKKGENLLLLKEKYAPGSCVYVGDTHTDELACRQAEIPFIFAAYGFGKAESPAASIGCFAEIAGAVDKL